jgi:hypothetical protein
MNPGSHDSLPACCNVSNIELAVLRREQQKATIADEAPSQ